MFKNDNQISKKFYKRKCAKIKKPYWLQKKQSEKCFKTYIKETGYNWM